MAHTVSFSENGKPATMKFPTYTLAANYARNVKGVVLSGGSDENFQVKRLASSERSSGLANKRTDAHDLGSHAEEEEFEEITSMHLRTASLAEERDADLMRARRV